MTTNDDFSPMVEQGELEPASGLLARVRRRHDLSPVAAGFVRVLIAGDGSPIAGGQELTGGEKRWARAKAWITVDVRPHTLEYDIPFSDPTGRAGFIATTTVSSSVRDPSEIARQGISSVKDFLLPVLRRTVVQASTEIDPTNESDPIKARSAMRQHADRQVREATEGSVRDLPHWLDAEVMSITVAFDQVTERQHAELVGSLHRGEMIDANKSNEEKQAEATLAVRDLWRKDLLPHLSSPSQRIFEVAFANPTDENIANAVAQVSNTELTLLSEGFEILKTMVEKDFVDKNDPIYMTIRAISGKIEHLYLPGTTTGLPSSPSQSEIEAPEVVDQQPPEEKEGDRDWDSR